MKQLVIVTGLSGSGKSIALNALEDIGFYCVDNLPAPLLATFTTEMLNNPDRDCNLAAVGMDVRAREADLHLVVDSINALDSGAINVATLFLEARENVLLTRYSETRRRHPLSADGMGLIEAIACEKKVLQPMRVAADSIIDTSVTNPHELRDIVRQSVAGKHSSGISLVVESFGFKHGAPQNADFLFDTRCLSNPHWEPELRPLTGLDAPVANFLRNDPRTEELIHELVIFLQRWLGYFDKNDRSYITIAIGCTGGQHRSVFVAEQVGRQLVDHRFNIRVNHRELA